ncbi:hypothetical protein AB7C87_07635 [Natrarchaeobius sp. A-rgal3]|uniref:hypothetical protein n=1 Tax=Natrarchaeobius versutus TaxID=1679078 RepID=UPI00350FEFBA
MAPASERFGGDVDFSLTVAFIMSILACDRSRSHQERIAYMLVERFASIEAGEVYLDIVKTAMNGGMSQTDNTRFEPEKKSNTGSLKTLVE